METISGCGGGMRLSSMPAYCPTSTKDLVLREGGRILQIVIGAKRALHMYTIRNLRKLCIMVCNDLLMIFLMSLLGSIDDHIMEYMVPLELRTVNRLQGNSSSEHWHFYKSLL
jgi:hypothetical protein